MMLGEGALISGKRFGKFWPSAVRLAACALVVASAAARAEPAPPGWQADGLDLIGFSSLGGHVGAFKLTIKQANGHWYLYMGHSFESGWSILDVTDPKNPTYIKFIKGPPNTITSQVTLHDNLMLTGLQGDEDTGIRADPSERPKFMTTSVLLWDISDPVNPKQIGEWNGGGDRGSHRNSYPGGRYAYLATTVPGYRARILVVLDVSDPTKPKEAGRFSMPGQHGEPTPFPSAGLHGPANISPDGKMATMGYMPSIINLDISDIAHPKLIGELRMTPPFASVGAQSEHTVLPLWDRGLIYASSEASKANCQDSGMHYAALIDNKNPAKPRLISMFPTPVPPKGAPYADFCSKGGRFGPHNVSQEIHLPDVQKPGNMMYIAYFNAGVRAFDISDAYKPTETAWFMPPDNPIPPGTGGAHASPFDWCEDILVDTRGNIYVDDDHWGLWILRDPKHPLGK